MHYKGLRRAAKITRALYWIAAVIGGPILFVNDPLQAIGYVIAVALSGEFIHTLLSAGADLGEDTYKIRRLLEVQLELQGVDTIPVSTPEFSDSEAESWR